MAITSQPGKTKSAMARLLDPMEEVVVSQQVETVGTATGLLSFGCCKVETENSYLVKDARTGLTLLAAEESSSWCMRNPCLCCDCVCWCCHSDCSSRRPFTLSLAEERGACPVLEMARPCASDCLPCCLQSITVRAQVAALPSLTPPQGRHLGTVQQVIGYAPPLNACGKFEVSDFEGNILFVITTPCLVTTCCCTQAEFPITSAEGEELGQITKSSSNVAKELPTDGDRFVLSFPPGCSADSKALLLGALFLFDYLFYED